MIYIKACVKGLPVNPAGLVNHINGLIFRQKVDLPM